MHNRLHCFIHKNAWSLFLQKHKTAPSHPITSISTAHQLCASTHIQLPILMWHRTWAQYGYLFQHSALLYRTILSHYFTALLYCLLPPRSSRNQINVSLRGSLSVWVSIQRSILFIIVPYELRLISQLRVDDFFCKSRFLGKYLIPVNVTTNKGKRGWNVEGLLLFYKINTNYVLACICLVLALSCMDPQRAVYGT